MNTPTDPPILMVNDVTKAFGGLMALNSVSFEVRKGEVVGLIGPNGAGKSTIIEVISGFYSPTRGSIFFEGERIDGLRPHQVSKKGIARTFQLIEILKSFTVLENILLPALQNLSFDDAGRHATEILELLNLGSVSGHRISDLSLAEQRLLEVGRALSSQPKMIFLDEVMAGLTREEVGVIISLVRKVNEKGITFLVVEHRLEIIREICTRLIVLNFGSKIVEGPPEEVMNDKRVITAYIGEEGEAI